MNNKYALMKLNWATKEDLKRLKGIIYRIVNIINGKSYIGKATNGFSKRYTKINWFNSKHNKHFQRSKKKYGKNNFKIQILEHSKKPEELCFLEDFYILLYKTIQKEFGYNKMTAGLNSRLSDETKKNLSLLQRKPFTLFLKQANNKHNNKYTYDNTSYISGEIKMKIFCKIHGQFLQTPSHHIRGRGCPRCAYDNLSIIQKRVAKDRPKDFNGKPVYQIDIKTNKILNIFKTGAEAERFLIKSGIKAFRSCVSRACLSKTHFAYGFLWKLV